MMRINPKVCTYFFSSAREGPTDPFPFFPPKETDTRKITRLISLGKGWVLSNVKTHVPVTESSRVIYN